jgi:hypothetical protein
MSDDNEDLQAQLDEANAKARELETKLAKAQYGDPVGAQGGGGGNQPKLGRFAPDSVKQRVWDTLEKGDGLQRSGDKLDVNIFSVTRLREAVNFQREAHPELGLGAGGSYRGDGGPNDRTLVNALSEARKQRQRAQR